MWMEQIDRGDLIHVLKSFYLLMKEIELCYQRLDIQDVMRRDERGENETRDEKEMRARSPCPGSR